MQHAGRTKFLTARTNMQQSLRTSTTKGSLGLRCIAIAAAMAVVSKRSTAATSTTGLVHIGKHARNRNPIAIKLVLLDVTETGCIRTSVSDRSNVVRKAPAVVANSGDELPAKLMHHTIAIRRRKPKDRDCRAVTPPLGHVRLRNTLLQALYLLVHGLLVHRAYCRLKCCKLSADICQQSQLN